MKPTHFIIDPTNFKGYAETSVTNGIVDFSLNLYDREMTFEEYKEFKKNPNLICLDFDTYYERYYKPFKNSLCGQWEEITPDTYDDMLNVLPPIKWCRDSSVESFFVGEAFSDDLHGCYIQDKSNGKCYTALRSVRMDPAAIRTEYRQFRDKQAA
ncbi:MAG: hypothetical protein ABJH04_08170 [Cyclobacteriaceae bacterium]